MKTFKRLMAVFGVTMLFAVFGWGGATTYSLNIDSVVKNEADGTARLTVRVDPKIGPNGTIHVEYKTVPGTAMLDSPSDYTYTSGTLNITNGNNVGSITYVYIDVPLTDDSIAEPQEYFTVQLSNASIQSAGDSVAINTADGQVTINDDDVANQPTLSINNPTVVENAGSIMFSITRSSASTSPVAFSYTTSDGTASQANDYALTAGTGTIAAGSSTTTISVLIIDDLMAGEGSETFFMVISNPSSGTLIDDGIGEGTITDNDIGFTLAINDAQIAESDSNITANVNLVLSEPAPAGGIVVTYHTMNGTATAPDDYTAVAEGTVTIPEGNTSFPLPVTITGDNIGEGIEDFTIVIDSATASVAITDTIGKVTVFDDDGIAGACSSYVGMMTINEYQNNPNYFDSTHPLATKNGKVPGNYIEVKYLDLLVKQFITNDWTIAVYTSAGTDQLTWDEVDDSCTDPRYDVFQMSNNVMGAKGYVVIKDANGNEVDVLNIDNSNHYTQGCTDFIYDTDFASSAQNKDIFRNPDGTGDWYDHGNGANSGGSRCINRDGGGEVVYTIFDAIDTDVTLPAIPLSAHFILKTKVVSKPSDIKIVSLDIEDAVPNDPLVPITAQIKAYLVDTVTLARIDSATTYDVVFNNSSSVTLIGTSFVKAHKSVKVQFEYCELGGVVQNSTSCWNETSVQAVLDQRRISQSRDTFAIRPDKFDVDITADTIFKAGQVENFIFRAPDFSDNPTADYNETQNVSFAVDLNISNSSTCPVKNLTISPYVQFVEGMHEDDFSFNDIGDINMSIHEIVDDEFALTDNDDTPDDIRLITPHNVAFRVIPHHFNIEANLTDHNSDNNLTYLHDMHSFDSDDNYAMGAVLEANITAMHADDINITRNYIDTCYAQDTNLTLTLNGTTITYPGSTAPLAYFLYYNPVQDNGITLDAGEGNNSLMPVSNGMSISFLIIENNASSFPANAPDGNGTTHIEYKLNFDRKQHLPVSPIQIPLSDVNITDTDVVEGTTGTLLNQNATFYYARTRASKFFYEDISEASVFTPILVDVYCDLGFTACGNLGINTTNAQINEANWWLSLGHNTGNNDGNITLTEVSNASSADWSVSPTVNIVGNAVDTSNIVSRGTPTLLPLTVEIEYDETNPTDTNHWLIYNPNDAILTPSPFYKVRFIGESGWTGYGKTGFVVDGNASTKKNKRLGW